MSQFDKRIGVVRHRCVNSRTTRRASRLPLRRGVLNRLGFGGIPR